MFVTAQHFAVIAKPFACIGGASDVKLTVYDIADLVDDWLFHGISVTKRLSHNDKPFTRRVSTGKRKGPRRALNQT
jgi:hypothetical protein